VRLNYLITKLLFTFVIYFCVVRNDRIQSEFISQAIALNVDDEFVFER
jgi:hypothetical protein